MGPERQAEEQRAFFLFMPVSSHGSAEFRGQVRFTGRLRKFPRPGHLK